MTEIGKNIKELRTKLGLTQEELAAKVGYKTKSAINKIELGVNDLPQKKIVAFAEALGTTPADLMGWSKELEEAAKEVVKNDALADIVARLRTDDDFLCIVQSLYEKTPEQISFLAGFFK